MTTNFPFDYRQKSFGAMAAVQDPDCLAHLAGYQPDLSQIVFDERIAGKFCSSYQDWLKSSQTNVWTGLDDFKFTTMANGTTEVFDKFYMKNSTRRFRCFRAEYKYHELAWRSHGLGWARIEDDDIRSNDAVVISLPFSDTGDKHQDYESVLERCSTLGVPVLVDCAYFGICQDLNFNLEFPCITDVSVSLSKMFPVAHARIGMRLTRQDNDDALFVLQKTNYVNRIGAAIGLHFIEKFSPDYIVQKYRSTQIEFCQTLKVEPTKTVLLATTTDSRFSEYNRGGASNRLSFHRFLPKVRHEEFYQIVRDIFDQESFLQ